MSAAIENVQLKQIIQGKDLMIQGLKGQIERYHNHLRNFCNYRSELSESDRTALEATLPYVDLLSDEDTLEELGYPVSIAPEGVDDPYAEGEVDENGNLVEQD